MPTRRNTRRRRIEEVYGDGNPPPNQPNPEISEDVQQALNLMMHGLITQVIEAVRQAGGTATPNNVGGSRWFMQSGFYNSGNENTMKGEMMKTHCSFDPEEFARKRQDKMGPDYELLD
ncbi:hypothetical protein L6452_19472 [Arctium lappa]|uniref:Uncharacterized protein n=1 Tax=Arctium lappa TaxID=4217 RepID=A0ACB9B888_ARCLA|nr:hypothetical protein L6452_19472 [Arctium lappa]